MHFTGTKSLPLILLLLEYKKCSARMEAILLMQCIIIEPKRKGDCKNLSILVQFRVFSYVLILME